MKHFSIIPLLCGVLVGALIGCHPEEVTKDTTDTKNYRLDSVYDYTFADNQWTPTSKILYTYMGDKKIGFISYVWQDEQWTPSEKSESTYSGDEKAVHKETTISYNRQDEQWVPSRKYEYTGIGSRTIASNEYRWQNNQWELWYEWHYTYTGDKIATQYRIYLRSYGIDGYTPIYEGEKYEYTYDGDKVATEMYYRLQDGQWVPSSKYEYTYNGDKVATEIYYSMQDGQWVPSWKYEYTYNGDKFATYIRYNWEDEQWVITYKEENTWSGNKIVCYIRYFVDREDNQLKPQSKWECTYDAHQNKESHHSYYWINGALRETYGENYEYNYISGTDKINWQIKHSVSYDYNYQDGSLVGVTLSDTKSVNYWTISETLPAAQPSNAPRNRRGWVPDQPEADPYLPTDGVLRDRRDYPFAEPSTFPR